MSLIEDALKKQRGAATGSGAVLRRPREEGTAAAVHWPVQVDGTAFARRPTSGLPACSLDRATMAELGYRLVSDDAPALTAQFRSLKHQVMEQLSEARLAGLAPLLVITSATPGDGKSFVSLNLAYALSLERDLQVTLVDYDPFRRRTSQLFGIADSVGLLDVMAGASEGGLPAVERESEVAQLSVIPVGRKAENMSELLTSASFDAMIELMKKSGPRRVFLFDCAPVLASPLSAHIARRGDLSLVVVRAEATSSRALEEALSQLGSDARVHLVLNGNTGSITERYYGYSKELRDYAT